MYCIQLRGSYLTFKEGISEYSLDKILIMHFYRRNPHPPCCSLHNCFFEGSYANHSINVGITELIPYQFLIIFLNYKAILYNAAQ